MARIFRAVLVCLAFLSAHPACAQTYDILIRGGRLVDGSGNPWVFADVGVIGDRIAFVGLAGKDATARTVIDASGLVVAPGFIDMLGQSERSLLIDKQAFSKITQGITTEITGEGGSIAPLNDAIRQESRDWAAHFNLQLDWTSLDQYFDRLERQGAAVNLGTYVGATQARKLVIGNADRAPTEEELKQMKEYVQDAMLDGALGLSSSLIYAPAFYASTEELVELAKAVSAMGGIYATHIRNEGDKQASALEEAFRIAREANIPVEIFHIKVSGQQNWGNMAGVIKRIEQARASGLDITADQYPYVASATSLSALIPPKYHEGGSAALLERLRDPAARDRIRAELAGDGKDFENMWRGTGGPQGIMVSSVLDPELKKYEGKTIAVIAEAEGKDPFDTVLDLIVEGKNRVGAVYFTMNEVDVRLAMQQPWVSFGTDYSAVNLTGPLSQSKSHPRAWGTFPRVLGKYVREEKLLRLEDAVRKMTSLAAQRVKLQDRGLLRTGNFADITIFNPETVSDRATFENPTQASVGIEYVLVNGVLAVEKGAVTGKLGGRPLRGPAYAHRAIAPQGLRPPGRLHGVVTTPDGYALPRTEVSLFDSEGKKIASATSQREGQYEILLDRECRNCRLQAERMGFRSAEKSGIQYNGSNPLWFSFVLRPSGAGPKVDLQR